MENNSKLKIVKYDVWCKTCKHCTDDETSEPCNECLTYPTNESSTKPIKYDPVHKLKSTN